MTAARSLLVVFAALALGGCDILASDNDDRAPDAELIVGAWTGTGVSARVDVPVVGVQSVPILGISASAFGASFQTSAVTLDFDPDDDATIGFPDGTPGIPEDFSIPLPNEVSVSGTYSLDDSAGTLTLTRAGIPQDLVLGYRLRSETSLEIIAEDAEAFAQLLGIIGGDAEALAGVVSGGSIRYRK